MATEAQISANRANSLKSCGPKTYTGRAISSQNAAKHRMYAACPVAGPEDETEFQTLIDCLTEQYRPETPTQHDLVHQMADARWRYLRSCEEERALYNLDYKKNPGNYDRGEAFIRLMDSKHLQYSRRCQAMFDRKYQKALAELRRLQAEAREHAGAIAESPAESSVESMEQRQRRAIAEAYPEFTPEEIEAEIAAMMTNMEAAINQATSGKIGFVSAVNGTVKD